MKGRLQIWAVYFVTFSQHQQNTYICLNMKLLQKYSNHNALHIYLSPMYYLKSLLIKEWMIKNVNIVIYKLNASHFGFTPSKSACIYQLLRYIQYPICGKFINKNNELFKNTNLLFIQFKILRCTATRTSKPDVTNAYNIQNCFTRFIESYAMSIWFLQIKMQPPFFNNCHFYIFFLICNYLRKGIAAIHI